MERFRYVLDLQLFAQEKTERATPKKRQEARKKGQVAKSMELPAAFILLFSFALFLMLGSFFKEHIFDLFTVSFMEYMNMDISMENVKAMFAQLIYKGIVLLAPIMAATVVIAILGNYLQIGFLMSGDPLMLKLNKLNPLEGAKRIFSMRAGVEFLKSMMKLTVVGVIAFLTLWSSRTELLSLASIPLESILTFSSGITIDLGLKIGAVLVVIAVFDYIYQRYEHEKSLRMSKQDIKDEYKKTEGDPLIKGKIRERQRKMALQRMMQEVPKADVVITNPTHFAVALKYEPGQMEAPVVIAKGQDYVALKMKEIANEHRITIMENKPLARTLYAQVEIGEAIPAELFQAVAEVLAYVYKLRGKA